MKRYFSSLYLLAFLPLCAGAENPEGISPELLQELRQNYTPSPAESALRNAVGVVGLDKVSLSREKSDGFDTNFSHRVKSKGITDQKQSGRCWLFTGLNVLRSQMMADNDIPDLQLSQAYNFFFDQLEKSNLFLQAIIDTSSLPADDRTVEWLFQHPLSDGGQYTGLADNLRKYGVVPSSVMSDSFSASSTSRMNQLLSRKLREDGLKLRRMAAEGASDMELGGEKDKMLADVYKILSVCLGEPPASFSWTRLDGKGNVVSRKTYTPQEFYEEFAGNDLKNDYVMLMNDPSRPYWKLYEIDYDRHTYDGGNWTYVNLPVEEIKKMAIESIKDSTMMYFSCDVGKYLDRDHGVLDIDRFDYEAVLGVPFGMDKADRIRSFDSASSHAMTLVAVDLDENGNPLKWMVENSWGPGANDGHLIMTDPWFDEYMFRLVVDKKYAPKKVLDVLRQTPEKLPAWDPMYHPEL